MAIDDNPNLGKIDNLSNDLPKIPDVQADFKNINQPPPPPDPIDTQRMDALNHDFRRRLSNQSLVQASNVNIGRDPFKNYDPYQFSTGRFGSQPIERIAHHPAYKRLGFNPWMDNDHIYNIKGTNREEFARTAYESMSLFAWALDGTRHRRILQKHT